MFTLRATTSPRHHDQPGPAESTPPTPFVAVGALLLQPRDQGEPTSTIVDRGAWPIFVIVLDDLAVVNGSAGPLFDPLDRPRTSQIPVAHSHFRWSVDSSGAVLKLALQIHEPTSVNLDIVMPARALLDVISQLPGDVTFAITTKQHADKLTERVRMCDALHEMILLVCSVQSGAARDGLAELRHNGLSQGEPLRRGLD